MNYIDFKKSFTANTPPTGLSRELEALWHEARGDWDTAHELAQAANTPSHCLIHAYLHRKEGDNWNAEYWYTRAGRKMPAVSLQEEWEQIVKEFLK